MLSFLYHVMLINKAKTIRITTVVLLNFQNKFQVIEDNKILYKSAIEFHFFLYQVNEIHPMLNESNHQIFHYHYQSNLDLQEMMKMSMLSIEFCLNSFHLMINEFWKIFV